jgi:vacuolar iron transporter family protein
VIPESHQHVMTFAVQKCRRDEHTHYVNRAPWLRAAVLGANDGLVSVGSLLLGVSAANPTTKTVLLSGVSALLAGVHIWRRLSLD